jgi:hypothetical protein
MWQVTSRWHEHDDDDDDDDIITVYRDDGKQVPYIVHDPNGGNDLFVVWELPRPGVDYIHDPDSYGPPDEEGLVFEVFGTLEEAQCWAENPYAHL